MGNRSLLRAKVRDPSGRPIANARVWIEAGPEPIPDIAALSDGRGEVVMSIPLVGRYGGVCAADGFGVSRATVEVSAEGILQRGNQEARGPLARP